MNKLFLIIVATLFTSLHVNAQYIIQTFAGTGTSGFSGDGGAANLAQVDGPQGVDVDASGNVYIADKYNNRIRKVTSGIITTFAGNGSPTYSGDGGQAILASLNYPSAIAINKTSAITYISDYANQRVRAVAPGGIITTFAGNGNLGFSGDGGAANLCEMYNPYEVAVDNSGNVFICDRFNHRVRKVNFLTNVITTIAGTGNQGFSGDGDSATLADLNYPSGVHVDGFGNVYIADQQNHRIRKITGGIITTIAGTGNPGLSGDGGPAILAELYNPHGICLDASGNIYIADSDNNCVRKITPGGTITTIAGNGTPGYSGDGGLATLAQLTYPTKVAINATGNVYVADFNNHAVRVLINTMSNEETSSNQRLIVYPNPTDGIIQLLLPENSNLHGSQEISVTNLLGEVVLNKKMDLFTGVLCNIDISSQPAGIYLLRVGDLVQRIIKK